jgi:dTDP-glucose pyrophosphorylase
MSDNSHLKATISPDKALKDAIHTIKGSNHGLCVVIDSERRILGTITDGDCRRALIRGLTLDAPVTEVMNTHFIAVEEEFPTELLLSLMKTNEIRQIPIVDKSKQLLHIVGMCDFEENLLPVTRTVEAVILAGGKGTRLAPLTRFVPKPMLPVAGKPILERIVEDLVSSGITNISISVNYLAKQIEDHFQDGSQFGAHINYLREQQELGTGGPLTLLPPSVKGNVLVINGDVLTNLDFGALVDFHEEDEYDISLCASTHKVQIPYGVLSFDSSGNLKGISEKPTISYPVNSGVYVLSERVRSLIPADTFYPITKVIEEALSSGYRVGVFPIHEGWDDIGLISQYFAAQSAEGLQGK